MLKKVRPGSPATFQFSSLGSSKSSSVLSLPPSFLSSLSSFLLSSPSLLLSSIPFSSLPFSTTDFLNYFGREFR
ncbi:hypothetical protein GLOIN_2v1740126 [Rhizophagus irregularis DAOM 181602=DAOM 197198]|uniref:Uncharacterized protein n=1 Tax=Rhizophagus irregularis (strain DAOM 181602 / DAOM 197198 / MUCL 43194) TaxID=747089 RepID=A0A2P4NLF5_RHIID|nr:hypothetical protein GLOIN_2v1740126 [Rhizophagus irregularis DAOM 181602=DAOM 197198]POG53973.1 hypothetical protein GLOIN_2v1740126 [Rhizophagus irregularis DAOM 181602=DAOM 197198]|eukprot:XP_025164210.1 hypothetical protein GLOIN_2v1740126 [Rhizophagus irregularis DAOM 181602=DAOM 197198]